MRHKTRPEKLTCILIFYRYEDTWKKDYKQQQHYAPL